MAEGLGGLAGRLIGEALLNETEMVAMIDQAGRAQRNLISFLLDQARLPTRALAEVIADEFGLPFYDLDNLDAAQRPHELVTTRLLRAHRVLPLSRQENRLLVGMSDPTNLLAQDEIRFHTGLTVDIAVVDDAQLRLALDTLLDESLHLHGNLEQHNEQPGSDISEGDAPVVRFINQLLESAIRKGASDLHFEPYEHSYRIRFRIDGVLHNITEPPAAIAPKLAARLKILSNLDISERRLPQDGHLKLTTTGSTDFRINTLPTLFGEKVVLRILDPSSAHLDIETLGFDDQQRASYTEALNKTQGIILVTGPTGSGKTVTLYSGLNRLNQEHANISTAEDPVEINLEGINQVSINNRIGLGFAEVLRAFLRQDPDIIMIGEIRDPETASMATRAAQTGHLVLSTLHTNSAAETLTRLLSMGVPAFNLATSVTLIIAQRLVRCLCHHCREAVATPRNLLAAEGFSDADLDQARIYRPTGCNQCHQGFKGRTALFEVVPITADLSRLILDGVDALQLKAAFAEAGHKSLRQSGLVKAIAGITSVEEVMRVTTD